MTRFTPSKNRQEGYVKERQAIRRQEARRVMQEGNRSAQRAVTKQNMNRRSGKK